MPAAWRRNGLRCRSFRRRRCGIGAPRQAQAAHVTNVTWAQGSSAHLPGEFGRFTLVTMGRSFHWMDREQVPAALTGMVDDDGGLVIANDSCLVRPTTAWQQAIEDIQHRFLPPGYHADSSIRLPWTVIEEMGQPTLAGESLGMQPNLRAR
jgi:hypothetical protein